MNHGKIKKSSGDFDQAIERLNKRISRFLGKRDKLPPVKKTSNKIFFLIIILFSLIIWLITGFYYLSDNQYGLIFSSGKITTVEKGLKVGFTLPYPFGSIEVLDSGVSQMIDISSDSFEHNYTVLTSDLMPIAIDAKFAYQIIDPKIFYINYLQDTDNIDNMVLWHVENQIHQYIANKPSSDLLKDNLTVIASELREQINQNMSDYGIEVVKLNINSLSKFKENKIQNDIESQALVAAPTSNITSELLLQAHSYKRDHLAQTRSDIDRYNQLLPQYKANPRAIVEQMYYDTLSSIPVKKDDYPLLNLSLSDLMALESGVIQVGKVNNKDVHAREFSREVVRERNLSRSL